MATFRETAARLRGINREFGVFAGLDGFVDEIIHVVEKRMSLDASDYKRFDSIDAFGQAVRKAAGYSANFEMIPVQVKLGGNGPIFANALLALGMRVTYCGSLGHPDIHPVFKPMAEHPLCEAVSPWEPAHTDALEFLDGKLIMGKMRVVHDITWERFIEAMGGASALAERIGGCDMLGMLNWTMLPFMSDIWEGILQHVLPLTRFDKDSKPLFFFDIADPAKRTAADICRALELMKAFNKAFKVVLGLNEKEFTQIAEVLGFNTGLGREALAEAVFARLNIDCLVIHPTTEAFAITAQGFAHTNGPYCPNPVLTTGAGDNFNAGFCLGQLSGLDAEESLQTGVSASGFYVRNGRSAAKDELVRFMEEININGLTGGN